MSRLKAFIPSKDERLLSGGTLRAQISLPRERFGEADWHGLLDGYRQSSKGELQAA